MSPVYTQIKREHVYRVNGGSIYSKGRGNAIDLELVLIIDISTIFVYGMFIQLLPGEIIKENESYIPAESCLALCVLYICIHVELTNRSDPIA